MGVLEISGFLSVHMLLFLVRMYARGSTVPMPANSTRMYRGTTVRTLHFG
jgi:hypothetical protein